MQGIGMLTKPHYIKEYTMQGHPVQGLTVPNLFHMKYTCYHKSTLEQVREIEIRYIFY